MGGKVDWEASPEPETIPEAKVTEEIEKDVVVEKRRRRGKRLVTKKTTGKDEKGYLVTKTEKIWESFSEEEEVEVPVVNTPAKAARISADEKKASVVSEKSNDHLRTKGKSGQQTKLMSFFKK